MNRRKLLTSLGVSLLAGMRLAKADEAEDWVLLAQSSIDSSHGQIETPAWHAGRISRIKVSAADAHIKVGWIEMIATRGQTTRHHINQHIRPGSVSNVIVLSPGSKKVRLSVSRMPKVKTTAAVEVWGLAIA